MRRYLVKLIRGSCREPIGEQLLAGGVAKEQLLYHVQGLVVAVDGAVVVVQDG